MSSDAILVIDNKIQSHYEQKIREHHHFEELFKNYWHNPRQNRWFEWSGSTRRSDKRSVFHKRNGPLFGFFCSSRLTFFMNCVLWMILCSAEAILASSTSKFGIEIPRIDDENCKSSTESNISTSLIHCIASVGNCEQVHTSVLNFIPQQTNVAGVGNLSKWGTEICSRCLSAHNSLQNLFHLGWLNFWLTVVTGISNPELVFDFHSSHV